MGGRLDIRITPSDVGKRVSVRSLTGPSERAARFTDTVGTLTSWTDGVLSITRRSGVEAQIEEAAVVAGKVVPPARKRSRGLRAAPVEELVRTAADGWPAVEEERLGGWRLRAAAGFTARANSVCVLGDPGLPLERAVGYVEEWYAARGLPPRFQVTPLDAALDSLLAERGWERQRPAALRVGPLAPLVDDGAGEPPEGAQVRLAAEPDEAFYVLYQRAQQAPEAAAHVLGTPPPDGSVHLATVCADDGTPLAVGRCAVQGRWAGFAAVEVAAQARRRGLATLVMRELTRAALRDGASAGYLQVEPENAAAHALYDRLGFLHHHDYAYRSGDTTMPPATSSDGTATAAVEGA